MGPEKEGKVLNADDREKLVHAWLWGWEDGTRNAPKDVIRHKDTGLREAYRRGRASGECALDQASIDAEYIYRYH